MSGLFISASGMLAAQRRQAITANNIANSQTPGFRASRALNTSTSGGGVTIGDISQSTQSGPLQLTGRPLDAAASEGFFAVRLADGSRAFTRQGRFSLNAEGQIVTSAGAALDPPVQAPANATSVTVSADGSVFARTPQQLTPERIGGIEVFQFPNSDGLETLGGGLFRATGASGVPVPAARFQPIEPGALEGSNVNLATEQVDSILNLRSFEANAAAFRAQDEVLGELLDRSG